MTLTDDQKQAVSQWIEDGAGLSDIQKYLREEFHISLTYLETRLLVDDLKLALKEPERSLESLNISAFDNEALPPPSVGGGKVRVTMDSLTRPGTVVSGHVTFSDNQTAEWYLDQLGRLALNPKTTGYRPKQQDIQAFQRELEQLVRRQGL